MYEWNLQPQLVIGLAGQIGLYLALIGPLRRYFPGAAPVEQHQIQLFVLGWLALVAALLSPIDRLAGALLTMHMVQHILLTLVAAPLLLLGTPRWMLRPILKIPGALPIGEFVTGLVPAFIAFNVVFSLWHVPRYYEAALAVELIHSVEHISIFVLAGLLWWPICSPLDELPAPPPILQVVYLFLQSLPPTILGAILTFAEKPLYGHYERAQRLWGLSALTDQQLAGLLMWIPGSLLFFAILTVIFIRWLEQEGTDPRLGKRVSP
jgi:putative membrane protein